MDDIARELGISKKTLYVHFKDKRDVVEKVLKQHENIGICEIKRKLNDGINAMEEYFELILIVKTWIEEMNPSFEYDLEKYYPDLFKNQKNNKIKNMTSFFIDNLNRGKLEGVYREDFDAEIITKFHVTTITNLHNGGMFTTAEMYNYEIYKQYFLLFMRGVASKHGLEILENKIKEYGFNNMEISK